MNGTKTKTAGLLLAALSISSSGIAQEVARGDREVYISLEEPQGPGNTTVYHPDTGVTLFIPSFAPPVLPALPGQTPTGGDTSGGTISSSIPELPIEMKKATLGEFLEGPHFSDLDIDLDAIPPAILNAELDDLRLDPSMMAALQSVATDERVEMLLDSLLNNPGQITSDMLETIQMPTGTGS